MTIGAYIRHHRERAGLSLRALGAQIGISKQYLYSIEVGGVRPSEAICSHVAAQLALDRDEVLLLAGHTPPDVLNLLRKHPQEGCALIRKSLAKVP